MTNDEALALASKVANIVERFAPFIVAAEPELSAALSIATKILHAVIADEPMAIALYEQIISGATPSAQDMVAFASEYEQSYQKLQDDIEAKLATLA